MADDLRDLNWTARAGNTVSAALGRIEVLALFPVLTLAAYWLGFDNIALVTAFGVSGLLALAILLGRRDMGLPQGDRGADVGRPGLTAMLDRIAAMDGRDTACFLVQIDEWTDLVDRWGHDTCEDLMARSEDRLRAALRNGDMLVRLGDSRFGITLAPLPSARLSLRDAIAARLAQVLVEPIPLNGTVTRLSASIGHTALLRRGSDPAATTFRAAEAALGEAVVHGPGAIRAYAAGMGRARVMRADLASEVEPALHDGAITAWFQPQICARTGAITGMETLARWQHSKHGLMGPKDFMDAVQASGQMPALGQTLIHQALTALADWDKAHAPVPELSINLSCGEMHDGGLITTLQAELARFGIDPARIRLEISEPDAVKADDDTVIATLVQLKEDGHRIDLDGFGLGATSFPVLQRFGVDRIKIARPFTLGVETDAQQADAVAAIIAMAQALGISTLASGVETPQELEKLVDLGCDVLQGFYLGHPMRGDQVADWARAHSASGKTIRLDDRRRG
ncbi:bifunctional diguanylate cyclase/phosphodiesterase [Hasllibacter sp. MH4015]|uniref:bifunctional diguanylate cyclase/phosphodiesterase n=1 Tax=Hasllibacter sp. MH4015 TaxID=2854029 RepID=UPI001CD592D1|nr:bifunctional diguanylate cyclase/phosphodiesterase [Hasllibacter sp. MH4015]